ncbi:endonuclease [Bacillus phage Bobb]|uniref:Uncharacterized protein n=1 Tax=Bacillus phage Bobb TaxID=1527469 RepID=A0A076G7D4_9CAUD|nr:endonuclease [Bacillus phage Bobb]AII28021.1 hypothetical protein [Bacillus phage Bobb]
MKQCTNCKELKDEEEFALTSRFRKKTQDYARHSRCRECVKILSRKHKRKYYENNRDKCLERARVQRETDPNIKEKWKESHQKNKEHRLEQMKVYAKTEQGKEARRRAQERYRQSEQYKMKQNARKKVLRAVQSGKLVRPTCCTDCKKEGAVEAHHEDYNKPLDVKWLCKTCHENTHHLNEGHGSLE